MSADKQLIVKIICLQLVLAIQGFAAGDDCTANNFLMQKIAELVALLL